jgi:ABC-2 type transport system ATP-binding protein
MSDTPILVTHALGKRFGKRWAVDAVHLEVHRGDIFGFLGPNGAGKSTTIRMLLTLIRPTTGTMTLFGEPLTQRHRGALARVGGMVERPDFYLYLSARRNLEIVGSVRGGATRRDIDEVLDIVGLLDRAGDRVKTYSHGMKQRLAIAQALLGRPEFVLLDEPTNGLDPQGIKEVRDLVRRLSTERGMTVFLSSHLLGEIEHTATRMAIINRGRLIVQGGVRDLLAEGGLRLHVSASPPEKAFAVMAAVPGLTGLRLEEGEIRCTAPDDAIPAVTRRLVEAGVEVRAVVPRRSLEEYFLHLTEGASDVAPARRTGTGRES